MMLDSYRILDLTDEQGFVCGKILADMGADVIKIEKPGGDLSRNIGPYWHDIPNPEKSLYWFAYNSGKRGITLDIETQEGQKILQKLVQDADIIIESFPPGYLDSMHLNYEYCVRIKPDIIMTSISPYGQNGPYKDFKASDLQTQAMSGTTYVCGYPDEAPVIWSGKHAYFQAGLQSALGTLIALWYREISGKGQHVDLSIRDSMTFLTTTEAPVVNWVESKMIKKRQGYKQEDLGGLILQWFYPCKDGFVIWRLSVGVLGHMNNSLVAWMEEDGMAEDLKIDVPDWTKFGLTDIKQEQISRWEEIFGKFFLTKTKKELLEGALEHGIVLYPLSNMSDVMENKQLLSRNYWVEIDHPELGAKIGYPGILYRSSTDDCRIRYRAPLIGEHNHEIYINELGFSERYLSMLKEDNVI